MVCMQCYISGRVQGVFFRASARHEADRLGITGYAKNLPDGRVEVLACGSKSQVDDFCAWLSQGSTHAEVTNVACQAAEAVPPLSFSEQ